MKKIYTLVILITVFSISNRSFAQCTPDVACIDIENPGEICPETLPDGEVGVPYNQKVTIIPPATFDLGSGPGPIYKITLDAVNNMPPGITYTKYNNEMFPNNSYCIDISGTPTDTGSYQLSIKITPYVMIFGTPVAGAQVTDDTSLVMKINPSNSVKEIIPEEVILKATPNPITNSMNLTYKSDYSGTSELIIYDLLGKSVYNNKYNSSYGMNSYNIDTSFLRKGIYYVKVKDNQMTRTCQIVKI